ncbi:MAG: hypothetical protein QGH53_02770, partial [Prochlorococcaceae cyanobacterium ETNP18_MAG_1]|nr:hypothetical protein [Prochlorococcaceae cyanobacterium ETNP18_MAG_1]
MSKTTSTTSKKPKKSSTQKQPDQMSTAKANNKKLLETWRKDAEVWTKFTTEAKEKHGAAIYL